MAHGSYTMMAKPMKTFELHYSMIQFLIIFNRPLILDSLENKKNLGDLQFNSTCKYSFVTISNAWKRCYCPIWNHMG